MMILCSSSIEGSSSFVVSFCRAHSAKIALRVRVRV
jgi:hypothetical protein